MRVLFKDGVVFCVARRPIASLKRIARSVLSSSRVDPGYHAPQQGNTKAHLYSARLTVTASAVKRNIIIPKGGQCDALA